MRTITFLRFYVFRNKNKANGETVVGPVYWTLHVPVSHTVVEGAGWCLVSDIELVCIMLMCSLRSQFLMTGLQTGRQGLNATVLFLLYRFANNFGVAMGFSFSRCQAAQALIRLPEHTLIHSAKCMVRQTDSFPVLRKSRSIILNHCKLCRKDFKC